MNNRIEFDYEKIKDGFKPVTRNGIYPTEVHRFETCTQSQAIIAVVNGQLKSYSDNGKWSTIKDDHLDLFLEPPVRIEWWNVYPSLPTIVKYESLEECTRGRLATKDKNKYMCHPQTCITQQVTYQGDEIISVELVK